MSDSPEVGSRKLQEKRARREAEERKAAERKRAQRKRTLVTVGLAVLVGAVVVGLIINQQQGTRAVADVGGPATAEEAGCTPVETHEVPEQATHVPEGTTVPYATNPPTSGDHYESPSAPGFYSSPVQAEQLVHNLEHGQIVMWYRPDAPQEVKDKLEQVTKQDSLALIATPFELEGSANFALSGWGVSQSCVQVSQPVIDDFRRQFQGAGPEKITPPFEG